MDGMHEFLLLATRWGATVPRAVLALGGLLLLLWGPRLYRLALAVPGMLLGALVAPMLVDGQQDPVLLAGVTLVLALAGALAVGLLEALALRVAGALLGGGLTAMAAPLALPASHWDPWLPLAGALVGMLLLPPLFRVALRVALPGLGAIAIAQALGRPTDALLVVGLWGVGVLWQLSRRRGST